MLRAEGPTRLGGWQWSAAFALGCAGALAAFVLGVPGNGAFVAVLWLAGFGAALVAPGWRGYALMLSGGSLMAALLDVADGSFGLVALIVAMFAGLTTHGALTAFVLHRLRRLGPRQGIHDAPVIVGAVVVLGTLALLAWFAFEFARNPA